MEHHEHEHHDFRHELIRLGIYALILLAVLILTGLFDSMGSTLKLCLFLVPYLLSALPVLKEAGEKLIHREFLEEDFLMAVASIGALCIGEYPEAVAVMLFYRVGEAFEDYAVLKSRRSIAGLMDIRPDYANIEENGEVCRVSPERVEIGTVILVRPGERIPLDGVIVEGESSLDTSALTGESVPREASVGQAVASGCVNLGGLLRIKTTSGYSDSTVSKILELVENASENKSRREALLTRFARIYTPAVVGAAVLLAVVPILLGAADPHEWVRRALIFLVVSCPCALVVSVPLSFFGGIGGASKHGILIKGSTYIEALADVSVVAMDKTGTLTEGRFSVTDLHPVGTDSNELLRLAAAAESYSSHPIAQSLVKACPDMIESSEIENVREFSGKGLKASVCGREVTVGNASLLKAEGVDITPCEDSSAVVYVSADGVFLGSIVIADRIKDNAKSAINELYALGVNKTVMLTGDSKAIGISVAAALCISEVRAELLPQDKVCALEALINEKERGSLLYVGDGINDAPVLARSDIGAAMGVLGSDAAIEAADVVLMDDDIKKLPLAVRIAKRTVKIARQNIWLALGVKFGIMLFGAIGIAGMWAAVFADVGVLILAVLNATRTLKGYSA